MEYTFSLHDSQAEEDLASAASAVSAAPYLAPPSTFIQPDASIAPPHLANVYHNQSFHSNSFPTQNNNLFAYSLPSSSSQAHNNYQFTFISEPLSIHTPLQPVNASIRPPLQNISNHHPSPAPQPPSVPTTKSRTSRKRKTTSTSTSQQTSDRPSKQRRTQPSSTPGTSVFGVTPSSSKHQNQQSIAQELHRQPLPVSQSGTKPAGRVAQSRRHQPANRNISRAAATDVWWFCYGVNSKHPPLGLNPSQVRMDDEDCSKTAPDTTRVRCRLCPSVQIHISFQLQP